MTEEQKIRRLEVLWRERNDAELDHMKKSKAARLAWYRFQEARRAMENFIAEQTSKPSDPPERVGYCHSQ